MSLATQIAALATRVGQEIKGVRAEMVALGGGGGGGGGLGVPVYVQQTQPDAPAIWYQTDADGVVVDILRVT